MRGTTKGDHPRERPPLGFPSEPSLLYDICTPHALHINTQCLTRTEVPLAPRSRYHPRAQPAHPPLGTACGPSYEPAPLGSHALSRLPILTGSLTRQC